MIRFSCPGCEATFNVGDEKAGRTGKCPKCSAQFTIPLAQAGQESAPPAPPPVADGGAVEINPCPKCGARLSVEAGDIGLEVECPTCRAVYPAEAASTVRPRNPDTGGSGKKLSLVKRDEAAEKPSRRREEETDEDERPSRRNRREEEADQDERPSRRSRWEDEEDEPPRRKKKRRQTVESKRVTAAILAWFLGWLGAHKFYLGYTTSGVILLIGNLCTCFSVLWIITVIEAIIYISKSDEDFIETYQVGQKEWF